MKRLLIILFMSCSTLSVAQNQNVIELPLGWSLFGYNCQESVNVVDAFSPIVDSVLIVKNYLGYVYLPEYGVNTIGDLEYSRGYQIKMIHEVQDFQFCEYDCSSADLNVDSLQQVIDSTNAIISELEEELSLYGCTVDSACNFSIIAEIDNGTCQYISDVCESCEDGTIVFIDTDSDGICDADEVSGCQNEFACNYNDEATDESDDCVFPELYYDCDGECLTDGDLDGVCDENEIIGCQDETACNCNPEATESNASCIYEDDIYDCEGNCFNDADSDGVCDINEVVGCIDASACNYSQFATDDSGLCEYPEEGFTCDGSYAIGAFAHGGIVFYVDGTGQHGLVAAMEDITEGQVTDWMGNIGYEWGCFDEDIEIYYVNEVGSGLENTEKIVNEGCQPVEAGIIAAQVTLDYESNGYDDWYLPSRYELQMLNNRIGSGDLLSPSDNVANLVTVINTYYWSSTESSEHSAYCLDTYYGFPFIGEKTDCHRVRAIRSF